MLRILPKRGCTNYSSSKAGWVVSSPNLPLNHLPLSTQLCEQLFTSPSSVAGKWFNPKRDPPRAQSFASLATHTHWKPHYQQQQRQQHWEQKQHQSMSRRATDSAAAAKPRDSEPDSSMCCGMRFIRCLRCTLRVCLFWNKLNYFNKYYPRPFISHVSVWLFCARCEEFSTFFLFFL